MLPQLKASENEKGKSIATGTAEERPVHKLKRPGSVSHLWVKNYFSFPSTAYRKKERYYFNIQGRSMGLLVSVPLIYLIGVQSLRQVSAENGILFVVLYQYLF
ncbi:uncharacterized protein [Solanum lycopersicum]|uniref:uncharacterized protein n=1 Tax=Solanum lycopersicum TaxID=4081 RepID=UPI0037492C3B